MGTGRAPQSPAGLPWAQQSPSSDECVNGQQHRAAEAELRWSRAHPKGRMEGTL